MKTLLIHILPGQAEQIHHTLPYYTHGSHARQPHAPSSPYRGVISTLLHRAIMHDQHLLMLTWTCSHFFPVMYLTSFPCFGPLV
jgi:hypothetical protein